jgi:hypothetical protein
LDVIEKDEVVGEKGCDDCDHRSRALPSMPEQPRTEADQPELDEHESHRVLVDELIDQWIRLASEARADPHQREEGVEQVEDEHGLHDPLQPAKVLGGAY